MGFMQLQVEHFQAYVVETTNGNVIVPVDVCGYVEDVEELRDYCEGEPEDYSEVEGWFARYSAPGYLDCTDYVGPYDTAEEAEEECKSLYGDEVE